MSSQQFASLAAPVGSLPRKHQEDRALTVSGLGMLAAAIGYRLADESGALVCCFVELECEYT